MRLSPAEETIVAEFRTAYRERRRHFRWMLVLLVAFVAGEVTILIL